MHFQTVQDIINFINRPNQKETIIGHIEHIDPFSKMRENTFNAQREHWKRLHTEIFTEESFNLWVDTIPGCPSCKQDFKKILETNPPRFNDWHRWSWEVHNIVNKKINKTELTWEEASKIWGW